MPQSAVKTGCVDQLLSPVEIAAQLERIGRERALPMIQKSSRKI
jgi:chemotaxis response regulator CheB